MHKATKKWTFMVYLAGDNNLASAGVADLKEMKKVGSTDQINVVAQFDNGQGHRTGRYLLTKGNPLEQDRVEDLGPTNTGDPAVLTAFVNWAVDQHPAEQYALVVWNHGNGWDDEDIYRAAQGAGKTTIRRNTVIDKQGADQVALDQLRVLGQSRWRRVLFSTSLEAAIAERGIAYDDNACDFLDNRELKQVVAGLRKKIGHKLDLLGMDACLMSMVEVIYELRDSIAYSVGSEQTEPGDGWPYDTILEALAAKPSMNGQELASTIVHKYIDSYSPQADVTQSACDAGVFRSLTAALDTLGHQMSLSMADPVLRGAVLQARVQAQAYERSDYVDIASFCELLADSPSAAQFAGPCQKVIAAVQKAVFAHAASGASKADSHGISVYFPMKKLSGLYAGLDFSQACRWAGFLREFQKFTASRGAVPAAAGRV